jgi:hypothetical protein
MLIYRVEAYSIQHAVYRIQQSLSSKKIFVSNPSEVTLYAFREREKGSNHGTT